MNRVIKFRVWDKSDGVLEMVGAIDWDSKYEPVTCNTESRKMYQTCIDDEKFVLMQFTGVKDESGREIYEGDILQIKDLPHTGDFNNAIYLVEEKEGCFWAVMKKGGRLGYMREPIMLRMLNAPVIGNVFENPGLLK